MLDTILQYLRTPLVVLSGTPVTTLTLLAAIAIVVAARIVAAVVGRSLERVLEARLFIRNYAWRSLPAILTSLL